MKEKKKGFLINEKKGENWKKKIQTEISGFKNRPNYKLENSFWILPICVNAVLSFDRSINLPTYLTIKYNNRSFKTI